jgi:hypothetical protein
MQQDSLSNTAPHVVREGAVLAVSGNDSVGFVFVVLYQVGCSDLKS